MSESDLMRLVEHASGFCDGSFARTGEIAPMWHAVRSNGESFIELHPVELGKDLAADFKNALPLVTWLRQVKTETKVED